MSPNLEKAIIQYLADEFKLKPENISLDSDFLLDFGLSPDQLSDLLDRIQDALDFTLPEDKIEGIHTISDLYLCLTSAETIHEPI
jgi:acyl carrier protein